MPELDCPTEVLPRVGEDPRVFEPETGWRAGVQWCLEHQYRVAAMIAGPFLVLVVILSTIDGGTSTRVEQPRQTTYQQGYSYGQRLDNEGYSREECHGRESQRSDEPSIFQMACEFGYVQ